jgi:hypothetical protein
MGDDDYQGMLEKHWPRDYVEPVDPQLKDWHELTWEEYQERLSVEEPILVPVSGAFVPIRDTGEWVTVFRKDGTVEDVLVTSQNYLGFTGYTARGELIVAYSDNREAKN